MAFITDTRSVPYFCEIFFSTDDESRKRPHGTADKLPCGILLDSRTSFAIHDNSSCRLTDWSPNVVSGIGYALCIEKEWLKGRVGQTFN